MMSDTHTIIKVGIADGNIAQSPNLIRTSGLGSCIGIVIYDLARSIAGLIHVMLPDSNLARQTVLNHYKYADTAICLLIDRLVENGARRFALKAKMAGGSEMFAFTSKTESMRIGPRNVEAATRLLRQKKIPILTQDVGGRFGRTITFDPAVGMLHIRTVHTGNKYI